MILLRSVGARTEALLIRRHADLGFAGGTWVFPGGKLESADRAPETLRLAGLAAENPDLYRTCMSDARTRQAYVATVSRYVEQNYRDRLTALGRQPRIPVPVMARGFAGATLAILDAWLAGELTGDIEELASTALDLFVAGAAWANGFRLEEIGYAEDATGE